MKERMSDDIKPGIIKQRNAKEVDEQANAIVCLMDSKKLIHSIRRSDPNFTTAVF